MPVNKRVRTNCLQNETPPQTKIPHCPHRRGNRHFVSSVSREARLWTLLGRHCCVEVRHRTRM